MESSRGNRRSPRDQAPILLVRSAYLRHLRAALDAFEGVGRNRVHEARKQLKRARAVLRLMRPALGDAVYRRENAALRDVARSWSRARDAQILPGALRRVLRGARFDPQRCVRLRERVRAQIKPIRSSKDQSRQSDLATRALRRAERRARSLKLSNTEWACIVNALRRTYKRARRNFKRAHKRPTTALLHGWRKEVQHLWHQVQCLAPLAAGDLAWPTERLQRLSGRLGDDHDLAMLSRSVRPSGSSLSRRDARALRRLIKRRRAELRKKAFALGERLLARKARAFAADIDRIHADQGRRR
jgi:hypothetical protein